MITDTTQVLEFLYQEPTEINENAPVIFLLHGYGSFEGDLFSFAQLLPKSYHVIALRAPLILAEGSYAWYSINFDTDLNKWYDDDEAIQARDLILYNIKHHLTRINSSQKQVDLLGFSQGAILSWSLGLAYPEMIHKIMALSGFFNTNLIADMPQKDISNLDCFSSHGVMDPVIPIAEVRKGIEILKNKKIALVYKEYDAPHGICPENFRDLISWLKQRL